MKDVLKKVDSYNLLKVIKKGTIGSDSKTSTTVQTKTESDLVVQECSRTNTSFREKKQQKDAAANKKST